MKKFKHTNLELEQARQESIKGYTSELNRVKEEDSGHGFSIVSDDLRRVRQQPKFISKGEEQ